MKKKRRRLIDKTAGTSTTPELSTIASGYGSIEPRNRPEDFRALREEFEIGVATENVSDG